MMEELTSLSAKHELDMGNITLACDGITALNKLRYKEIDSVKPSMKHCDIISAMKKLWMVLPIDITCRHVKGHQDDLLDFEELDRFAQLNVMMDIDAKSLLEELEKDYPTIPFQNQFSPHPQSISIPVIRDIRICDNMSNNIYSLITDKQLMEHWIAKERFSYEDMTKIDWENQERAMNTASLSMRRFVTKWSANWLGTGKNMKRWALRPHGYCPFCKEENEDTFHIMKCAHEDAKTLSHDALWTWTESMIKIGTCPRAVRAIRNEIVSWKSNSALPDIDALNEQLQHAILAQRSIGWKSFLEGLFSLEWKQYQKEYFDKIDSKRSHGLWVSKAIRICWRYITTIWVGRNQQLHQTDHILDMEGRKEMIQAIKDEYDIGLGRLLAYGFSYMFKSKPEDLASSSLDKIKHWLAIIKQGRIVYEDPQRIEDYFFTTGALYKTLDLHELNENEFEDDR